MDEKTLASAIEPYLMRTDMLKRTKSGRVATEKAFKHMAKMKKEAGDD